MSENKRKIERPLTAYQRYLFVMKNYRGSKVDKIKILQPFLLSSKDKGRGNLLILLPLFLAIIFCCLVFFWMVNLSSKKENENVSSLDLTQVSLLATVEYLSSVTPTATFDPTATYTVTPSATLQPTATSYLDGYVFMYDYQFRLSFYDPAIGKYFPDVALVNCANYDFALDLCVSRILLNNLDFHGYYGVAIACPSWIPDFARLKTYHMPFDYLSNKTFTCLDRGGAIVDNWIDFLLRYPDDVSDLYGFPFGAEFYAQVFFPSH